MARKKSVKRNSSKKLFRTVKVDKKKFDFVSGRLIFFILGFVVSFGLYLFNSNPFLEEVFIFLSIIFGFISIAYLIVFLIFLVMKVIKK